MRALANLEFHYARHAAAAIVRSPLRLALWLPYALSIAYFAYARALRAGASSRTGLALSPAHATAVGGLYVGLIGVSIALAAGGRVTAFRTDSEAILLVDAGIPQLTIAVWLQLRKVAASWTRSLAGVVYFLLLFAPGQAGTSVVRTFVATLLAFALQMTVELPAFLIGRRRYGSLLRAFAWAMAALGFAFAALGFFAGRLVPQVVHVARIDPGIVTRAVLSGSWSAVAWLSVALAASVWAIAILGRDALPDLYAASRYARARRRDEAGAAGAVARSPRSVSRRARGAASLVWKDWAAFRHARGALSTWLLVCSFWTLCGVGAATVARASGDASPIAALSFATFMVLLAFVPAGAASGLAAELSNPLFRLSSAPLRTRIAAWTFARAWRGGLGLALAPLAAGVASRDLGLAIVALPLTLTTYWSLQALGVGLFALFPSAIDARGPLVLLRTFATFAFSIPPLVAALVALALAGAPLAAACIAALIFALQGALVVLLAARRFAAGYASTTLA